MWFIAFVDMAASAVTDFFTLLLMGKIFLKPHPFYSCPRVVTISPNIICRYRRMLWWFTPAVVTVMAIFWGLIVITFSAFYAGTSLYPSFVDTHLGKVSSLDCPRHHLREISRQNRLDSNFDQNEVRPVLNFVMIDKHTSMQRQIEV